MINRIIGTTTAFLMSATASLAAPPGMAVYQANTPYGKFSCAQRAQNKFYALGASRVEVSDGAVWAVYGESRLLVWCRGDYAFVSVAGPSATELRDEIQQIF